MWFRIAVAFVIVELGIIATLLIQNDAESVEQSFGALESVATIIALVVAGLWTHMLFIENRIDKPRAKTSHKVHHWEAVKIVQIIVTGEITVHDIVYDEEDKPNKSSAACLMERYRCHVSVGIAQRHSEHE